MKTQSQRKVKKKIKFLPPLNSNHINPNNLQYPSIYNNINQYQLPYNQIQGRKKFQLKQLDCFSKAYEQIKKRNEDNKNRYQHMFTDNCIINRRGHSIGSRQRLLQPINRNNRFLINNTMSKEIIKNYNDNRIKQDNRKIYSSEDATRKIHALKNGVFVRNYPVNDLTMTSQKYMLKRKPNNFLIVGKNDLNGETVLSSVDQRANQKPKKKNFSEPKKDLSKLHKSKNNSRI